MIRIPPVLTLVNLKIWGEILEHAIHEARHYPCNESLTLKTLDFAYILWNTLYSRCIETLWPNHFDFNLQISGGIHAARDIWNADVYSQEVAPITPYFWQVAINSTDIPGAQVVFVTERSRNRSHVCSCGYTFFKSRIREKASLKETLTNRTTHGLVFSHGSQSHHKCDAVLCESMWEDIFTTSWTFPAIRT